LNSGLRGVTLNYEKAFLSKSLAKLFDAVNHMFVACPSSSEIDVLVGLINKATNLEDLMLKRLVARNVAKTVQLVCVRAEQLVINDGGATQVIGKASSFICFTHLLASNYYFLLRVYISFSKSL